MDYIKIGLVNITDEINPEHYPHDGYYINECNGNLIKVEKGTSEIVFFGCFTGVNNPRLFGITEEASKISDINNILKVIAITKSPEIIKDLV